MSFQRPIKRIVRNNRPGGQTGEWAGNLGCGKTKPFGAQEQDQAYLLPTELASTGDATNQALNGLQNRRHTC